MKSFQRLRTDLKLIRSRLSRGLLQRPHRVRTKDLFSFSQDRPFPHGTALCAMRHTVQNASVFAGVRCLSGDVKVEEPAGLKGRSRRNCRLEPLVAESLEHADQQDNWTGEPVSGGAVASRGLDATRAPGLKTAKRRISEQRYYVPRYRQFRHGEADATWARGAMRLHS
jgi:hypothetical protein